jgi:hypothetical protein
LSDPHAGFGAGGAPASEPFRIELNNRLVISWDLSPHWQIETDRDKTSEIDVQFTSESPERTRVELE